MDMALLITGTDTETLYKRQIRYILQLVKRFNLRPAFTRVAAVTNGNAARTILNFNDAMDSNQMETMINDLRNPGTPSNTNRASSLLLDKVFSVNNIARPNVQRSVIFFVTAGNYMENKDEVKANILKLQNGGMDVTVVVIGDDINKNGFVSLVNDPKRIVFLESEDVESISQTVDQTLPTSFPSKFLSF